MLFQAQQIGFPLLAGSRHPLRMAMQEHAGRALRRFRQALFRKPSSTISLLADASGTAHALVSSEQTRCSPTF